MKWSKLLLFNFRRQRDLGYFQDAVESIPGLVTIFSRDMTYILVNSNVERFVGLPREVMLGKRVGFAERNPFVDAVRKFIGSGAKEFKARMELKGKFESRWFIVSMSRIANTDDVLVVSTDIDDLVQAEREVAVQRQKSEEKARLVSIGELAAGIAHEINTPLFIITISSEQLIENMRKDEALKYLPQVETILATALRIAKIVRGMKNLSRSEKKQEFADFEFGPLVEDIHAMFNLKMMDSKIEFKQNIPSGLKVYGNSTQIGQVLLNLCSNAYDEIKSKESPGWISIQATDLSNELEISVSNSGLPIPPEIQSKLMSPFFTTKPTGKGTGLGLAICRRIAGEHQGEFYLDSESPVTRFVLKIPKSKPAKSA